LQLLTTSHRISAFLAALDDFWMTNCIRHPKHSGHPRSLPPFGRPAGISFSPLGFWLIVFLPLPEFKQPRLAVFFR
jgi:hypothetical protein